MRSPQEKIRKNRITSVVDSGVKTVYKLTTTRERSIKATEDHQFLTPSGYVELGNLQAGSVILVNPGLVRPKGQKKLPYRKEILVKQHKAKKRKIVNGCVYYRLTVYRAVYEAHMNGMDFDTYRDYLNTCSEAEANSLWSVPSVCDIHHKDGDVNNNSIDNLELVNL